MDKSTRIVLSIFLGAICLCMLVGIICAGSVFFKDILPEIKGEVVVETAQSTNTPKEPTPRIVQATEDDLSQAYSTLEILQNTIIPSSDWVALAEKFNGMKDIPLTLDTEPVDYEVGDTLDFWTTDMDTNENRLITAYLAYETENIYFWVEEGVYVDEAEVRDAVDTFADHIYPTDREFFGDEWVPGVDNDPHLYILYATGLGSNVAGYESSADSVLTDAHEYSNVHEMFYLNADVIYVGENYTLSVMAHEFQHLIHGYHDSNEETWLNEGFSELATYLNGYSPSGYDYYFGQDADIQLNEWPNDSTATGVHYGSSFLFTTYLLDRFGEETTKAVVANHQNGLESIDDVFEQEGIINPGTGEEMSADQLFMDWAVANFLNDPSVEDGRFSYNNYPDVPYFATTEEVDECNSGTQARTVSQYGTDYIQVNCRGDYAVTFSGSSTVKIVPVSARDGTHFIWSNKADQSDMTMTRQFDFTDVSSDIELTYSMWYDIETDYDFVYLMSSTDGESWEMIYTPSCSTGNISGNNFGCGYNDTTDGWQQETVDLSQFAGQKVWLRFEYVTDTAVTGEGFAIDAISISQVGYSSNFEEDEGGWDLQGFARIENQIPQTFLVSFIQTIDYETRVTQYEVGPGEEVTINVEDGDSDGAVLVVSGSARYTRQKGNYQFEVAR